MNIFTNDTQRSVAQFSLVLLAILVTAHIEAQQFFPAGQDSALPGVNETKVASQGIRKIAGRHLTLYTDLPPSAAVDELPQVFDAAVPGWCAYFNVRHEAIAKWKNIGCLMLDKQRFLQSGLLPTDLPPFLHGYQRGSELWWYEQPSDYYRRHLMLHEGTHAFMHAKLGGAGPPWYMEGTAELLATHRWQHHQLTLGYFPPNKNEVPEWGRIKIIRDDYRAGQAKSLTEIMNYDLQAHLQLNAYGWCWAASAFFDGHPRYQQRFRELPKFARDVTSSFSARFRKMLRDDEPRLTKEWQSFVARMDYGYDVAREAVEIKTVRQFDRRIATATVATNRGWQSSGLQLARGKQYRLSATGRYQLAHDPKPWWCEPNGVTIDYYLGQPLGIVMAAIVDETTGDLQTNGFLTPIVIGAKAELTTTYAGTLYLRINDHPAKLADNEGDVTVRVETN